MSGTITFPPNPTDGQLYTAGGVTWQWHANPGVWVNANTGTNFLALSGGTMTGAITLPGNAATALQAVPLQQVVPIAGGVTMTGLLTLSGNAATALQATPLQQVNATVAPAFNDVGRNLLHNALFSIQQRGIGTWTGQSYTADRWLNQFTTTGGSCVVQISPVSASNAVPATSDEAFEYLLNYVNTAGTGAGDFSIVSQRIEDVRRLAGKTVTVSFWAAAASGTPRVGIELTMNFGTGGSPTAQWNGANQAALVGQARTLGTAWARYTATFTLPSSASATFGTTAGTSFAELNIWISAGSSLNVRSGSIGLQTATVYLWGVQLEIGSVMTPLEKLDPVLQWQQCQRFFVSSGMVFNMAFNSWAANGYTTVPLYFPVPMRGSPTIVLGASSGNTNVSGVSSISGNPQGFMFQITATAASGAAIAISGYNASADL